MICRFCLQDHKTLANSHIIPKALFAFGGGSEQRQKSKIVSQAQKPKKAPNGIWDNTILCHQCEHDPFSKWDNNAIKFFQADLKEPYPNDSNYKEYTPPFYDYHSLKHFILSVLWRGHFSEHTFYQYVNLGHKHERSIREILLKNAQVDSEIYPMFFRRFNTARTGSQVIICPRYVGGNDTLQFNHYELSLPGFLVLIKVDSKPLPEHLRYFALSQTKLPLFLINFEESGYYKAMRKAANNWNY